MSGAVYSTYDIRVRAVHAVVDEGLPVTVVAQAYGTDRSNGFIVGYLTITEVEIRDCKEYQ